MSDTGRRQLNSWKEISAYLGRDVRTVARWERDRALPVHRVPGGRARTVFAFTDEIDRWLRGHPEEAAAAPRASSDRTRAGVVGARAAVLIVGAALVLTVVRLPSRGAVTTVEARGKELVALTADATVAWRHAFDLPIHIAPPAERQAIGDLTGDRRSEVAVVVGTPMPSTAMDERLHVFSDGGRLLWARGVSDTVRFNEDTYGPPWNTGPIALVDRGGARSIVWATHHHMWWPSIVLWLNPDGSERSRFVHAGWITALGMAADGAIVLAGYNNAERADVVAITDDRSWPGSNPPAAGTAFACQGCPSGRPLRYFAIPRSELSLATGSERRPAHIHGFADKTDVRMHQSADEPRAGELILTLSRSHDPIDLRFSDAYWDWHYRLEQSGRIRHAAAACPDRLGIRIRQWDRDRGWSERTVKAVE